VLVVEGTSRKSGVEILLGGVVYHTWLRVIQHDKTHGSVVQRPFMAQKPNLNEFFRVLESFILVATMSFFSMMGKEVWA
jgi:hypothetical protein